MVARGDVGQTEDFAVARADGREKVIEAVLPLLAAGLGFQSFDAAGELAIFRQVGIGEDFRPLEGFQRDFDLEPSGGRVVAEAAVDENGRLVFARTLDARAAVIGADDVRHRGKGRQDVTSACGQDANLGRRQAGGCRGPRAMSGASSSPRTSTMSPVAGLSSMGCSRKAPGSTA